MKITFWRANWSEAGKKTTQDFKNPIDIAHFILRNDIEVVEIYERNIDTKNVT